MLFFLYIYSKFNKKRNIMKNFIFFFAIVAIFFMYSCANSEIDRLESESVEEVQMKELIQYVRDIKPDISIPLNPQTRGFWATLGGWFKRIGSADGGGYRWGRDNGLSFSQSLLVSVSASLVTGISGGDGRIQWKINGEWQVYSSSIRDYQELGNAHNKAIYELCRDNPTLKSGSSISNTSLLSLVEAKTKAMGYKDNLSLLQRAEIMQMLNSLSSTSTMSDVTTIFMNRFSNSRLDYQFLEEYMDAVVLLEYKDSAISFTEQIIVKIDSMSGVQKSTLKCMVSTALCSINLWQPKI